METVMQKHIKGLAAKRKQGGKFKLGESQDPDSMRRVLRDAVDKAWPHEKKAKGKDGSVTSDDGMGMGGYTHVVTPGTGGQGVVERNGKKYGVHYENDNGTGKVLVTRIAPVDQMWEEPEGATAVYEKAGKGKVEKAEEKVEEKKEGGKDSKKEEKAEKKTNSKDGNTMKDVLAGLL